MGSETTTVNPWKILICIDRDHFLKDHMSHKSQAPWLYNYHVIILLLAYRINEHNKENAWLRAAVDEVGGATGGGVDRRGWRPGDGTKGGAKELCIMHNAASICFIEHQDGFLYGF